MNVNSLVLSSLMFLIIMSSGVVMPIKGQTETHDFRFGARVAGQCFIAYGPPGAGFPDPVDWTGLGSGQTTVTGYASDATATLPISIPSQYVVPNVYYSENVRVGGAITIAWTEQDGSRHSINAEFRSPATSEALFYPSNNQFVIPIPMYLPQDVMRFSGIHHVSGSKATSISGEAILAAGIYAPYPWPDVIIVLLNDELSGTLFFIGWARLSAPLLPAAKAYNTIVREQ